MWNENGYEGDEEDNVLLENGEDKDCKGGRGCDSRDDEMAVKLPEIGSTETDNVSVHLPKEVGGACYGIKGNSSGDIQGGGTCLSGLLPMDLIGSRDARQDNLHFRRVEWIEIS